MYEFEWNRALLMTALISGVDVSMPAFKPEENILNIHCDTS